MISSINFHQAAVACFFLYMFSASKLLQAQNSYRTLFLNGKVGTWTLTMNIDIRNNEIIFDGSYYCDDGSCKDKKIQDLQCTSRDL
jgi:hypothetical protein